MILNGFKAMKEAMVIKATDFAGRPQDLFVNDVSKRRGKNSCFLGSHSTDIRDKDVMVH